MALFDGRITPVDSTALILSPDLPYNVQDRVFSVWGRNTAWRKYSEELHRRLYEPAKGRNRHEKLNDTIKRATELIPAFQRLIEIPGGEPAFFKAYSLMVRKIYPGNDLDGRDSRQPFWKLDDAATETVLSVVRTSHTTWLWEALDILLPERLNSHPFVSSNPSRMVQFLHDLSVWQTGGLLCERTLEGKLPAELRKMVRAALMTRGGDPPPDFLSRWSVPRPQLGVEAPCPRNLVILTSRGCADMTCPRRTLVEWCAGERRWISTHQTRDRKIARCPRPCVGAACGGHHDGDFNDEDWFMNDDRRPLWSLYSYWRGITR